MPPRRTNSDSPEQSADEDYFNDLSQQPPERRSSNGNDDENADQQPKAKRIACVLCRRRKLRCDGTKPSCGTCTRLSHNCSYDEVRRKSGPKRGYVKALEARLAQVETLLKTQDPSDEGAKDSQISNTSSREKNNVRFDVIDLDAIGGGAAMDIGDLPIGANNPIPDTMGSVDTGNYPYPQELQSLGLEEALPTADAIADLTQIYFDKIHPCVPMIHRPRFLAATTLPPQSRPPICLRYAMWALAAVADDKYEELQDHFYQRARKYIERDEMRGHGEGIITLAHVQSWFLISMYEFRMTFFPRAWMSTGRAARLALMMGLNRLDGTGLDVKQCLPPPRDWTDREERRRTFWMCFCEDRYASIGTGWPMSIDERDILTDLPTDDDSFENSRPSPSISLNEALSPGGAGKLSPIAGVTIMACLFGRNLTHLHRPTENDNEGNLNGDFWRRHRNMDNILLNISLSMPRHLRLPLGLADPNIVFLNMCIHTSTICLHQAAIFKADQNKLPNNVAAESKIRCITAAAETASIMRMISHLDLTSSNPFITFCLYVAARVFVQYLKSRSQDHQVKASLHFLLTAMQALKRKNPLTESFLAQLDVDLQGAGLEEARTLRSRMSRAGELARSDTCPAAALPAGVIQDNRKHKGTFGDAGLARHSAPDDDLGHGTQPKAPAPLYTFAAMPNEASRMAEHMLKPSTTQMYTIPNRQRASGSNTSPQSIPDEFMDTSADMVDGSTPASLQNTSSHTSSHSFTPPPSMNQDNTNQTMWPNMDAQQAASYSMKYSTVDFSPFEVSGSNSVNGSMGTGFTPAADDSNAFTLPNWTSQLETDLSAFDDFASGGSGFTPAPSADLYNMTDADWQKMLDGGNLDMGWERGWPSHAASQSNEWNGGIKRT